ncbi:MAG: metalloregulator ArsR/SmtB family transcription factor [Alphaproteobacteria bacterium]
MVEPFGPGTLDGVSAADLAGAAGRAARLLRLMGHDARLMILCHLADSEQHVGALEAKLGLSQSALSQHLARLRGEGLVATRRSGQQIFYRLASAEAARILAALHEVYCPIPAGDGAPS